MNHREYNKLAVQAQLRRGNDPAAILKLADILEARADRAEYFDGMNPETQRLIAQDIREMVAAATAAQAEAPAPAPEPTLREATEARAAQIEGQREWREAFGRAPVTDRSWWTEALEEDDPQYDERIEEEALRQELLPPHRRRK